ncbi:MAG: hypothetical protein OXQ29_11400 [Rhodospirillaceae bacterium]|nr:hypothetical protein [Rhodospirillaceae bacterium]
MEMPRVPGNWQGVVNRINDSTDEIKGYFDPVPELIECYPWEVSIGYMFTRVEQAHNHLLRGAAVKIHGVNNSTATRFVDRQHMTRKEFSRLYKNVVGDAIPKRSVKILSEAEKIRDRVVHGKRVAQKDQRTAIVYIVEYAEMINEKLLEKANFFPFKADQRGYAGRRTTLPDATSAWVMKGLGFGNQGQTE